MASPFLAH